MDPLLLESLGQINKDIRKENKSIRNRLQSILLDNKFLNDEVLPCFPDFPIIPNERCGLWYVPPEDFKQTSYFKSTDGHTNQWDFSTRRLNFHLFPTLRSSGGIIIVDSTRRGKKIPDALSKTIPIWCAVLNYIMLLSQRGSDDIDITDVLFTPPETISKTEYDMIARRIPDLVGKLVKLDIVDGNELFILLQGKLLRPFWVYPGSSLLQSSRDVFTGEITGDSWNVPQHANIIPIILCTISYRAQDGHDKRHGFTYVQGAADDHELWSEGLTPVSYTHLDVYKRQIYFFISKYK